MRKDQNNRGRDLATILEFKERGLSFQSTSTKSRSGRSDASSGRFRVPEGGNEQHRNCVNWVTLDQGLGKVLSKHEKSRSTYDYTRIYPSGIRKRLLANQARGGRIVIEGTTWYVVDDGLADQIQITVTCYGSGGGSEVRTKGV